MEEGVLTGGGASIGTDIVWWRSFFQIVLEGIPSLQTSFPVILERG